MLVEIGFFGLLALAAKKALQKGKIDPESETIFHEALANLHGPAAPEHFRTLAKQYDKDGWHLHARILRARADYLDASPAEKAERTAIIARAMKSTNVEAILEVAAAFEGMTATGIARDLRQHAREVQEGTYKPEAAIPKVANGNLTKESESAVKANPAKEERAN